MEEKLTLDEMLKVADRVTDWKMLPVTQSYHSYKDMVDEVSTDTTTFYIFEGSIGQTLVQVSKIDSDDKWPGPGKTTHYVVDVVTDGMRVGYFRGDEIWSLYTRLENNEKERIQKERALKQEEQERLSLEALSKTKSLIS